MSLRRARRRAAFGLLSWRLRVEALLTRIADERRYWIPIALALSIFLLLGLTAVVEARDLWAGSQLPVVGLSVQLVVLSTAEGALRLAQVFLAVFVSIDVLQGFGPPARDRIDRPEAIVRYYEERDDTDVDAFLDMEEQGYWPVDAPGPRRVPAVVESVPSEPVPIEELTHDLDSTYYPLPEEVERLYEPVLDDLRSRFVEEGNFNETKLRPQSFGSRSFEVGETTFFNNFATNLSPDYDLYKSRTPRELLHDHVFDRDGAVRPLDDTDLPYIAAAAGMLVAPNGEAVFPVRGRDVVIDGMNLGVSFGGSWDKAVVVREGIDGQIRTELDEERNVADDADLDCHYLGTVRRLDLLGKPDCLVVATTDEVPNWAIESVEDDELVTAQIVPDDALPVEGYETLLENVHAVNERVAALLADSPFRISPALLYWIYLLNEHAALAEG